MPFDELPKINHVSFLEDHTELPAFLQINNECGHQHNNRYSCAFCGVGDTGLIQSQQTTHSITDTKADILNHNSLSANVSVSTTNNIINEKKPTTGCMKFKSSMGHQESVFPIHLAPSILNTNNRTSITYSEAIKKLADLLLSHRPPYGRTLIYACGQVDYFTIFSFQEVFRLLGIRNLAGNAEHCLNAGAVHNEILTGQEGPFLTIEQSLAGNNHFFLLNGWNGLITHPPVFYQLCKRKEFDAYLIEVVVTESAKMLASKLGAERILLIRSGSDPHLALSVANEILTKYPQAVEQRFINSYSDSETFKQYYDLAKSEEFSPENVAARIAPEPSYEERLLKGIRSIAAKLVNKDTVPINIPSVGLSQTKGVVSHCLWGNLLAMLGKYGLKPDGTPFGGTLRIPGQINAQTEVQGLSRNSFMGRVPVTGEGAVDAARRMGLPDNAYELVVKETARAALDYSAFDEPDKPELFICFGTQFESNMMGREKWIRKLEDPNTTLVVVDPIPDPFTLKKAALIIPSPPHSAAAKLYQNGEWRLSLSVPRKKASGETRTDATIVYDSMAEISKLLYENELLQGKHSDLMQYINSGYIKKRFESLESGGALPRVAGEVSRPHLWERILAYMDNGEGRKGKIYCRPEHENGKPVTWQEILEEGSVIYGGVGTSRYCLKYEDPEHVPFHDRFGNPSKFKFFIPTKQDLSLYEGIILNSGRSTLSDEQKKIRFATSTFNSGKATPSVDMPDFNPLYISLRLAEQLGIGEKEDAKITNAETGESLILTVIPTDRVKGNSAYMSFHKSRAEIDKGIYINNITSNRGRCPYTSQSNLKATVINIEKIDISANEQIL